MQGFLHCEPWFSRLKANVPKKKKRLLLKNWVSIGCSHRSPPRGTLGPPFVGAHPHVTHLAQPSLLFLSLFPWWASVGTQMWCSKLMFCLSHLTMNFASALPRSKRSFERIFKLRSTSLYLWFLDYSYSIKFDQQQDHLTTHLYSILINEFFSLVLCILPNINLGWGCDILHLLLH